VAARRWLADEMVGRLARYLRFVGEDVEYVRGASDDDVIARATEGDREILTRDRALAARCSRAFLLRSSELGTQWKELRAAWPGIGAELRFDRCTECNGRLEPYRRGSAPEHEAQLPSVGRVPDGAIFACTACGHLYWEGSHTARIRAQLAAWAAEESR
jgi:uncharacterized protein